MIEDEGIALFIFGNRNHCVCAYRTNVESAYSNFANPQIGKKRKIYVETESLDEIFELIHSYKLNITTCGLGICVVAMALLGLFMAYVVE